VACFSITNEVIMETRTYYENILVNNLRRIPDDSLPKVNKVILNIIDLFEKNKNTDQLIDLISLGFEIEDIKNHTKTDKRQAGFAKGTFKILEGFDDPIEDFREYM
jgi:hypothetical protein